MRQQAADGRAAADRGIERADAVVLAGERELISRLPDVPLKNQDHDALKEAP